MNDPAGIPRTMELAVGSSERVLLPSGMGGGYLWSAIPLDPGDAATVEIEITPPPPQSPSEPLTSSHASETLVVTALRPGRSRWMLRQARTVEPDQPAVEQVLEIEVTRPETDGEGDLRLAKRAPA